MGSFEFGDEIIYRPWVTADGSTLMAVVIRREKFIGDFTDRVCTNLYLHSFVALL
jgi:hypothetical protein